ncbi:transposase domain-containing protein, partial [Photobacterium damselae subsp. piscicida]|uniref:transposase domain-containing protein n=1 Tax=Photobacterium damselae TaxID=38293 RepID=UPI004040A313
MDVSQALNVINNWKSDNIETLSDLLPIELIDEAYSLTDTVTMRKRKLTLESMVWLLVGMAIYNNKSMKDLVNQLDIVVVTPIDLLMVKFTFYKRSNNLIVHLFAFR